MFTVFLIGGTSDGAELGQFETEREAVAFAKKYGEEHIEELEPVWGGIGIVDGHGIPVEW